ncbi:flavin monoamine oxidase family protein [Alkalibacterium pelagium]|uniref:Monoamine oxidase n=1 Tax=Alkalibacterium pelagium TaxID=426702 RepID=A0A1H7LD94_9LACT|nr:NAD(P)/FAD-dependent oxidoreductase [Alkalibacterium pelagium]GEN50916.1 monoamine oxidase [Alkalibacterium pelagium]SEK96859.1 Monoamine oxidase [Alkalibacterium pelagium]
MYRHKNEPVDVMIVGAGLAGLSAAVKVKENGLSFKVLEASDRAGGKVYTEFSEDGKRFYEKGAQFVNKDMTEMISLIEGAGMELKDTRLADESIVINEKNKKAINFSITENQELLNEYELEEHSPLSTVLSQSIEDKWEQKMLKSYIAAETTVSSDYINAKAARKLISRITTRESELKYQASGPLNNVITHLTAQLGDAIHYHEPVISIDKIEGTYQLKTEHGNTFEGRALILAIPPTVANRIDMPDSLQNHFRESLDSFLDGSVIKLTFLYDEDFWRHHKVGGKEKKVFGVIYVGNEGVNVMDSSNGEDENRLTMFIGGDKAKDLVKVPPQVRENFALDRLIDVFGEEAEGYKDIEESIWVDSPYTGGGYGAMVHTEGNEDADDFLGVPFEQVVFASTELAPQFPHFMEGAIRSGKQSAERLIEAMGK